MGQKPPPKNFLKSILTKRVASKGFQSFGLLEGAGVLPSKQWPKCTVRLTSVILYLTDFWMQAAPKLFVYQIGKVIV